MRFWIVTLLLTCTSLLGTPEAQPKLSATDLAHGAIKSYPLRKEWLLSLFRDITQIPSNPRTGMPIVLAKMFLSDGQYPQTNALTYAAGIMDFKSPFDRGKNGEIYGEIFTYPCLARFLYMYGDRLTPEQREHLKSQLLTRAQDFLSHGTENHAIMRIASGYLICQYFPGETWTDDTGKKRKSEEMMAEQKKLLLQRGKGFFRNSNQEVLSSTYIVPNIYPLLNLYDFANDSEVKTAAEALTLYHLSELALNDFDGFIIPPFQRENAQQEKWGPPSGTKRYAPIAPYLLWLYWGQNRPMAEDLSESTEPAYNVFFALSKWTPPAVIGRIAMGEGVPYAIRSSIPGFGHWGSGTPKETLRSVWRERDYAIGTTPLQRFNPDGFFLDYDLFGIAWSSKHRFNYIDCFQPYWRSNLGENFWNHGSTSPFEQAVHHKNTAIVLFDIPRTDPWAKRGRADWYSQRDKHYDQLFQLAQCRFPKTVDQLVTDGDWYFLREGNVYVGIRALRPGSILKTDINDNGLEDFNVIKSYASKTGFLFEVGTTAKRGSFDNFRRSLKANPLSIDWNKLQVSYRNTDGDQLWMRYNPDLTEDKDHIITLAPEAKINEVPLNLADWPITESPEVTLKDCILKIGNNSDRILVDWQKELPVISR